MGILQELTRDLLLGEVVSVTVGLGRAAVVAMTNDGLRCGIAVVSSDWPSRGARPLVQQAGQLERLSPTELATLAVSDSPAERGVGMAAINAFLPKPTHLDQDFNVEAMVATAKPAKKIAVVGHFPFVDRLRALGRKLDVLELRPKEGDLPAEMAEFVLPKADIIIVTGTTLENGTFDKLAQLPKTTADVYLVGPTTPLASRVFSYNIKACCGAEITAIDKTVKAISQGATYRQLKEMNLVRQVTYWRP